VPTLLERSGRLLLHLREADHGLCAPELQMRAAEPVEADMAAHVQAGFVRFQDGRYHTGPEVRAEIDQWVVAELEELGRQGHLYFAYGSNMDPEQMYLGPDSRVPLARFLCKARLPGYMLAFPRKSALTYHGAGVAGVVSKPDGEGVWGVLYLIDDEGLATLDEREGHPRAYTRSALPVIVKLTGTVKEVEVSAVIYLHVDDGSGGGPPAVQYLARLVRVAGQCNIDVSGQEKPTTSG